MKKYSQLHQTLVETPEKKKTKIKQLTETHV